jgi:hypothetical protein
MKEIRFPEDGSIEYFHFTSDDEPYTEYVFNLAEDISPYDELAHYMGYSCSPLYVAFLYRYFGNKVNKSFLKDYEEDQELKEMIISFGYDFEKFWYLLLFIYDYTYSASKKVLEWDKDKIEYIEDICKFICEEGAQLTLNVKGKKKVEITNTHTLEYIHSIFKNHLASIEGKYSKIYSPKNNDWDSTKQKSDSYHIWYFTTIFLKFFRVCPPLKIRRKKGQPISLNKKLLISKLVYLLKISKTGKFEPSETILNAFIKQYKNEPTPGLNRDYLYY